MKKFLYASFLCLVLCLGLVGVVAAQSGQLKLSLTRDWGYGGFNGDIQGLFSLHASGPADLAKVVFYLDSTVLGEVDQAPFNLQFTTDNYALGVHTLSAVGTSSSGAEYQSNSIQANFVAAGKGTSSVFIILGVVLVAIVLSSIVPFLMNRRKGTLPFGTERNYGMRGGAICPKCGRPFPLPLFGMNLGFSKLVACPHCGKFSVVRPASIDALRQAERAELDQGKPGEQIVGESEEERLKKELDDSKFQ